MKKNLCFFAFAVCLSRSALAQTHVPLTSKQAVTVPIEFSSHAIPNNTGIPNSGQYPIQFAPAPTIENRPLHHAHYNEPGVGSSVILPQPIPEKSPAIGQTTRHLMQYQANTTRQANSLPMLGVTANKSWKRYTDSFDTALPEWFEERLEDTAE